MNYDVREYAKIYSNWIDSDKCLEVIQDIEANATWRLHTYNIGTHGNSFSPNGDKELDITNYEPNANEYIMNRIWDSIFKYIVDLKFVWFDGWNGFTTPRYNRYTNNKLMNMHTDHIHDIFDGNRKGIPTLTVLFSLNDGYEGGDLLMWNDEKIDLRAGDVLIFPSNFLYPHRVTPVTKGTRYSGVSWAW